MTIRIDAISLAQHRSITWTDSTVRVRDASGRVLHECPCHARSDFDALCDTWGIERVGRGTWKRMSQQKVIEEILF